MEFVNKTGSLFGICVDRNKLKMRELLEYRFLSFRGKNLWNIISLLFHGEKIYIYIVNISSNVLTKRWTKSLGIQRSLFSLPLSLRGRAKLASTIFPIKKSAKFALPVLASPPLLLRKREKDSREEEGGRKKGVYTGGGRGVSRR